MPEVVIYTASGEAGGFGERIHVKAPFALKDVCSSLTGRRWDGKSKTWHVPATTACAEEVVKAFFGNKIVMDEATTVLVARAQQAIAAQDMKFANDLPDLPTRTPAWIHQRRAFAFAKELDASMLAMDMGTGKSLVAIGLAEERQARRVLILCPVSVVGVWPKQFRSHALDPDEWEIIAPTNKGTIANRAEQMAKRIVLAERKGKRFVCVTNYEACWRSGMEQILRHVAWDMIIPDESHRIKSAGGKQSVFVNSLHKRSRYRTAATGTPMPHSPLDIYAQYRFLDPGVFGTSKNRFKNKYAIQREIKRGVSIIEGWQNMEDFNRRFASIAFVVSKEEALPDLPEKMPPTERTFMLGNKALTAYASLARDFIAGVEGGTIVAQNALTRVLRFRQLTSGFAKTDEGNIVRLDDGREKALRDFLEDTPEHEPIVVFAAFHPDLDAIQHVCESMGRRYGELSGRRRDGLTTDSTMNPDIDILGCQLKSGGVGIDLTRSSLAVYYSIGYELGDYDQSTDRLHRPGQTRPCRYIHLIADNAPIDRVMLKALSERKNLVTAVLDAAKEHEL